MDKSYVSRILAKLEKKRLITRKLVSGSKGIKKLYLTNTGKEEAKKIDWNGDKQIYEKLKNMDKKDCDRLYIIFQMAYHIFFLNDLFLLHNAEYQDNFEMNYH